MTTHFERFWSIYPRKVAKGQAHKTWQKLVKGMPETEESDFADLLVGAVQSQKNNRRELENTKSFVPPWKHPTTWLNGECWNDEIKSVQEIREQSDHNTSCCECGKSGPYRERGWIVREEKTFCTPCWAKKYEDGPTGLNRIREQFRKVMEAHPRLPNETWANHHTRIFGNGKGINMGGNQIKVSQSPSLPDDIEGAWSAEKCASEVG